ncbi:hypothetical protein BU15DRAFT_45272 [Melanogaster broomeanus]|nr:hypothetical protein BU15DRAFT_45272 [Melanogaster broomeanus]
MAPQPPSNRQPPQPQPQPRVARQARAKAVDFISSVSSEASERVEHTRSRSTSVEGFQEVRDDDDDESASNSDGDSEHPDFDSEDGDGEEDDDDDADADAPRVAQWIDDEGSDVEASDDGPRTGLYSEESEDERESAQEAGPSRSLRSLEDDLSTLPMGILRNAQRSLALTQALSDSDSDQSGDYATESEDDGAHPPGAKGKGKEKPDRTTKPKTDLAKRANKHAPAEITSKRPVTRRRTVVEDKTPKARDPRFLHATGSYDPLKFHQQYSFLSNLHSNELKTLRENLKRARKLLLNSPSHLRAEREAEVKSLELAVKRAESAVNRDTRERIEADALRSVKHAEKEKRKHGKTEWWMKQSEKRELLTKARFDAIASAGGRQAVKKAIEKKQKKINQKEKRSRPFARGETGTSGWAGGKRSARSADAERGAKRRRVG